MIIMAVSKLELKLVGALLSRSMALLNSLVNNKIPKVK